MSEYSNLPRNYKRYDTTLENAQKCLARDGIVTIPNVLSQEECESLRAAVWDGLKYISKGEFDISKPDTWPKYLEVFKPLNSMLLHHNSVGHLQPIWDIRQHLNVVSAFAKIWDTEDPNDMITSFDGLSAYLPITIPDDDNRLHVDQGDTKRGFQCVQGLITLYDVKPGDATLSVLEKSHKYHNDYFNGLQYKKKSDFVFIDDLELYSSKGCFQTHVEADAGSLILWDSRTVHRGALPTEANRIRMVVYVCMMPRDYAPEYVLMKRINAFENMRMTAHYPTPVKLMGHPFKGARGTNAENFERIPAPVLTPLGRRLVGYEE